jgi:predicted CxxxxCH...CXXCH cytochrome family protein
VLPGTPVTLDGSASTGAITTYSWQQISGPGFPVTKVIADNTTGIRVNFTPTIVGIYSFRLTVDQGSTATTSVTVTTDAAAAGRSQCQNCHQANGVGTNAYNNWSSSAHRANYVMCANCHIGANTGGHPGSLNTMTVDRFTFTLIGPANGGVVGSNFCAQCHSDANQIVADFAASPHKQKPNGPTTCSGCHGDAHAVTATVNPCKACHADTAGNIVGHANIIGTTPCTSCHNPHTAVAGACDGCHECPPATASHLKHYSGTVAQAAYGDTRIARDFSPSATGYIMNCGNCHPMNSARHMDGVVDVELANPLAPAGSLKAQNPASAAYVAGASAFTDSRGFRYTKGTCSNVYCHSYTDWTTPGGVPLVTDCLPGSSSYWPPNLVITRIYKTITWEGGALSCSGCHANPPRSAYPANDGGAGNSHSWIDNDGYEDLHNWNMGSVPVGCKFCHYDTVQQLNSYTRDTMDIATLSDVPISNHSKHINGINDVSFDKQNPFVYQTYGAPASMSLSNATYDAPSKTCLNVSCHFNQTSVKWGTPYRYFDYAYECDRCHHYGTCQ